MTPHPSAAADPHRGDPILPGSGVTPVGEKVASPAPSGPTSPASLQGLGSEPNEATLVVTPDPNTKDVKRDTTTELVGFVVQGRRLAERLQIVDLDSIITPDGRRWLPLLRVLRAFQVKLEDQGGVIRFTPEGGGDVELDATRNQIQIKGQTHPLELRQAVSEITQKPDVYVLPDELWKILDMELVWDTELYEYRIQLDRRLSIWNFASGTSLLAIPTQFVGIDLPEALPAADRSRDPLQLIELEWRLSYNWRRNSSAESKTSADSHTVNIAGPRETLWGNVQDGQYKVQISHPSGIWSNTEGWRWLNDDPYVAQLDWFEWVHRLPAGEVTVGDSVFGLSELVYPIFDATGVRVNGLAGWTLDEIKGDKSRLGLQRYFGRTHVFEGPAPIGAAVELILNGRTIDVQNVRPEADAPPGMGVYRFEGVELPSGILNEVTLLIRETNGNEIRVERSIAGTPQLIPKGRAAYLGVLGTKRERMLPDKQAFAAGDFYGYITGGRVLYGLTDRLTAGVTLASEQDHHHRFLEGDNSFTRRAYPRSSSQAGTMLSYMPLDNLILSGDLAGSQGEGQDEYDDFAARTRAEYLPTRNLTFDLDLLNLGAHYFDGTDPDVSDRRGGEAGFAWKWRRNWTFEGGFGQVRDHLDGQLDEITAVNYQNCGALTTVLPRTALSARLHHLDVSTEEDPRLLTELGLRLLPTRDISVFGRVFLGEELTVEEDDRFLSLLRLRHAPRHLQPSQYWTVRKILDTSNAVSVIYNDAPAEETLSFVHDLNVSLKSHPLRVRSEFIKELLDDREGPGYGFRGRAEYLLDKVGYNYLGSTAEYRHGNYAFFLYLNLRTLYARHDHRLININESRVRTAYGAIHGKVFVDYNGNHIPDANEPGVANVKVHLGQNLTTVTDRKGYYVLSAPTNASEGRVYLDPDTVLATYTVTHGTQLAKIYRDSLTEVNLSVAPLISLGGRVVAVDPNGADTAATDPNAVVTTATVLEPTEDSQEAMQNAPTLHDVSGSSKPVASVRVYLSDPQSDRLVTDSVTGDDGRYYFGDVKPGRYVLRVDAKTLSDQYELVEQERLIEVEPTMEDFVEIPLPDLVATVRHKAQKPGDAPPPGNAEKDVTTDPNQVPR